MKQTVMEGMVAESKKLPKTLKKEKALTGFFFTLLPKFAWVLFIAKQDNIHFCDWHFGNNDSGLNRKPLHNLGGNGHLPFAENAVPDYFGLP